MSGNERRLSITGMTLSLDIKDLSYGAGQSRFFNMKAGVPEGMEGLTSDNLQDIVDQSLDMHLAMWESLNIAKYAAGETSGAETVALITKAKSRVKKMREHLSTLSNKPEEAES